MNIFQQYGIKEVADVCLYAIDLDENDDEIYIPVLYLDTLKVSTVEENASQTSAQGGIGNPKLITWDYGRDITVRLEDALFSPASQGMTWGGGMKMEHLKLYLRNFFDRATDNTNPNANLRGGMLTIEQMSDFMIIPDRWIINSEEKQSGYVGGTSIYCWLVNGFIISNDKTKKVSFNDLILFYREQTQKWYFFNGKGSKIYVKQYKTAFSNPGDIERYPIGYQFGKETYEWIKENLSGNNWPVHAADHNWNEYEGVATETIKNWQKQTETNYKIDFPFGDIDTESFSDNIEAYFLTQDLYIDGYRVGACIKNQKYSEMTEKEIEAAAQGIYEPYRYSASIDVEYNTNIVPPQELIGKVDSGAQDVFYLERLEKCFADKRFCIDTDVNTKHSYYRYLEQYSQTELTVFINPQTMAPYEPNIYEYKRENGQRITGNLKVFEKSEMYYKWTRRKAVENQTLGKQIIINADTFPGTYRLVGETYIRNLIGEDQKYQFEIPLCKVSPNNHLTLQAAGEPTTFSMNLTALRRFDGVMMKLTSYSEYQDNICKKRMGKEIKPFATKYNVSQKALKELNQPYPEVIE